MRLSVFNELCEYAIRAHVFPDEQRILIFPECHKCAIERADGGTGYNVRHKTDFAQRLPCTDLITALCTPAAENDCTFH